MKKILSHYRPLTAQTKKNIFISGSKGVVGQDIITALVSIKDPNIRVFGLSRVPLSEQDIHDNNEWKNTGYQLIGGVEYTPKGIEKLLDSTGSRNAESVVYINTIGGGHPTKENSYRDLNVTPVKNACLSLEKFQRKHRHVTTALINLSSHTVATTPEGMDTGYTDARIEAERIVQRSSIHTMNLRLGIVLTPLQEKDGKITFDTRYEYSPENFGAWPVTPIAGSGDIPLQYVCSSDIGEAISNAIEKGYLFQQDHQDINAVAGDMSTQNEIAATFSYIGRRDHRPCTIPLPLISALVHCDGGKGRCTPYAVYYSAALQLALEQGKAHFMDPSSFKRLLGKDATTISDIFAKQDITQVSLPSSNITGHLYALARAVLDDPQTRDKVLQSIQDHGIKNLLPHVGETLKNAASVILKGHQDTPTLLDRNTREAIIEDRKTRSFTEKLNFQKEDKELIQKMVGRVNISNPEKSIPR